MPDQVPATAPTIDRTVAALTIAVVIVATVLRLYALDRLPGINGDEAWYGVQAQRWVAGTLADWRTPTGNLPGPLQFGALALADTLFAPSFWLLRLPTVISSLAAMALAFVIARRFFGTTSGVAALLLMAALPANLIYARFGWDPSHSGLVILIATLLALARRPAWSALAFAFALWVHPTNVFAAPFLLLAFAGAEYQDGPRDRAPLRVGLFLALLLAALSVLAVTAHQVASAGAAAGTAVSGPGAIAAVAEAKGWAQFPALFVQFLSGQTVLAYLTGVGWGAAEPIANGIVVVALAGLLVLGIARLRPDSPTRAAGVVAGWIASLGAFFLLAGSAALQPGEDRYALCLIVPTVMAVAVLVGAVARTHLHRRLALSLIAAVALLALGGVWLRYMTPMIDGRGGAHRAFWTGEVEPKQAALAIILADSRGARPRIVAEDWWIYWPIAYLADGRADIVQLDDPRGGDIAPAGPVYRVGWRGGALDTAMAGRSMVRSWPVPTSNPAEQLRIWKSVAP